MVVTIVHTTPVLLMIGLTYSKSYFVDLKCFSKNDLSMYSYLMALHCDYM